jgi:hypothetical protein
MRGWNRLFPQSLAQADNFGLCAWGIACHCSSFLDSTPGGRPYQSHFAFLGMAVINAMFKRERFFISGDARKSTAGRCPKKFSGNLQTSFSTRLLRFYP